MAGAQGPLEESLLWHERPIPDDRPAAPAGAPHVVLLLVDALRRDQLSPWGGPPEVTPNFTRSAAGGAVFGDVIAQSVWNKPALVAVTTGQEATRIGVVETGDGPDRQPVPEDQTTLAEAFSAKGWHTIGLTANFNQNEAMGFAQGFDRYRDSQMSSFQRETRTTAEASVERALRLVGERPVDRPVFLQMVWSDLHKPFVVPGDVAARFDGPDHDIAPYRAVLNQMDDVFGQLLDGLHSRGVATDQTLVLVVATHGEGLSMPDSHGRQHGRLMAPSVAVVAAWMHGPGVGPGVRVDGLVAQVDFYPTLLTMAGLTAAGSGPGVDLAPLVRTGGRTTRTTAFTDTWFLEAERSAAWTSTRACVRNDGPAPADGFVPGCFDRMGDPDHLSPIEDAALSSELEAWRAGQLLGLQAARSGG